MSVKHFLFLVFAIEIFFLEATSIYGICINCIQPQPVSRIIIGRERKKVASVFRYAYCTYPYTVHEKVLVEV